MPKMRLTDAAVKRLKTPANTERVDYWDTSTPGFGIRISASGARSWVIITRALVNGDWKQKRVTLGTYPAKSLADARQDAKDAFTRAKQGKDPADVPKVQRETMETDSRNTFANVREDFLQKYRTRQRTKPSKRTLDELTRVLSHEAFKDWDLRPLAEIGRREILDAVDRFVSKGQETAANRYLTYLKMLFGWALDRDIIKADPTARIKPPGQEHSRERVLEPIEMRAIWKATAPSQAGKGDLFAGIVKVLMLTGQRRNEVAGMQWRELDLDACLWSLPGARTKNHRDHLVPLSEPVLDILVERQQEQADMRLKDDKGRPTPYVFTHTGKTPFSGWSRSKARLDGRAQNILRELAGDQAAELAPWTLHDLRRTLVTRMAEDLHVPPHIVEAIINHVSGARAGVAGVYNRALHMEERRKALTAWADYVLRIVGETNAENIIAMEAAR